MWHFTHVANLDGIVSKRHLLPDTRVQPSVDVANQEVKDRRRRKAVDPDQEYPQSVVSDHVPFYIAAKSPMLYVVCKNRGAAPLVQLGVAIGDLVDAGLIWCASDGNAAATFTRFSRDLTSLGEFVDYPLLCQRDWYNTPDDPDRKSRRSAEILVYQAVPVEIIRYVCASTTGTLQSAQALLGDVGGQRDYFFEPQMYY